MLEVRIENSNLPERDRSVAGKEDKRPASFHRCVHHFARRNQRTLGNGMWACWMSALREDLGGTLSKDNKMMEVLLDLQAPICYLLAHQEPPIHNLQEELRGKLETLSIHHNTRSDTDPIGGMLLRN